MAGLDARTGKALAGLDHLAQSVEKIFSTAIGQRIMREWFGTPGIKMLGENLSEETILRWWATAYTALELYEPRFRIKRFGFLNADRLGRIDVVMVGEYRPYAHLDFIQARLYISLSSGEVSVRSAA